MTKSNDTTKQPQRGWDAAEKILHPRPVDLIKIPLDSEGREALVKFLDSKPFAKWDAHGTDIGPVICTRDGDQSCPFCRSGLPYYSHAGYHVAQVIDGKYVPKVYVCSAGNGVQQINNFHALFDIRKDHWALTRTKSMQRNLWRILEEDIEDLYGTPVDKIGPLPDVMELTTSVPVIETTYPQRVGLAEKMNAFKKEDRRANAGDGPVKPQSVRALFQPPVRNPR